MEKRLVKIAQAVLDIEAPQKTSSEIQPIPGLLKLDENENMVGPSPKVGEAIAEHLRSLPLAWHGAGNAENKLKQKLSEHLALPKEAISCFHGSMAALECTFRTYLEPGVEALLDSPCNENISAVAKSTGARVTSAFHLDPLEPQIENLIGKINSKTRVTFLSNPNELCGASYTEAEIVFLLAYAERIMVVVQEEFVEFSGISIADLVMRFPNLVVIRSLSNAFGLASLEASYLLTDPDNMEFIERLKVSGAIAGFSCAAAAAALDDLQYLKAYIHAVEQSKKIILSNLPQTGFRFCLSPANFLLLHVSDSTTAVRLLSEERIFVRDLSEYDRLEGYLRITIGTPSQTEMLLLALGRLADKIATGHNRNLSEETVNRPAQRIKDMVGARKENLQRATENLF
jgi:histidinol-phosphate aminotransferase